MSFLDEVVKLGSAYAAEQGVTALDPDANLLEKVGAAIAGYEGAKIAEEKIGDALEQHSNDADQA